MMVDTRKQTGTEQKNRNWNSNLFFHFLISPFSSAKCQPLLYFLLFILFFIPSNGYRANRLVIVFVFPPSYAQTEVSLMLVSPSNALKSSLRWSMRRGWCFGYCLHRSSGLSQYNGKSDLLSKKMISTQWLYSAKPTQFLLVSHPPPLPKEKQNPISNIIQKNKYKYKTFFVQTNSEAYLPPLLFLCHKIRRVFSTTLPCHQGVAQRDVERRKK